MTTLAKTRTHTYPVEGTPREVRTKVRALERAGELALAGRPAQLPDGRLRVQVTVYARPLPPARKVQRGEVVWRYVLAVAGSLPFVGAAGYVAGRVGADVIAQVLIALGSALAAGFLLYALATMWHRAPGHHCPGCSDH